MPRLFLLSKIFMLSEELKYNVKLGIIYYDIGGITGGVKGNKRKVKWHEVYEEDLRPQTWEWIFTTLSPSLSCTITLSSGHYLKINNVCNPSFLLSSFLDFLNNFLTILPISYVVFLSFLTSILLTKATMMHYLKCYPN